MPPPADGILLLYYNNGGEPLGTIKRMEQRMASHLLVCPLDRIEPFDNVAKLCPAMGITAREETPRVTDL